VRIYTRFVSSSLAFSRRSYSALEIVTVSLFTAFSPCFYYRNYTIFPYKQQEETQAISTLAAVLGVSKKVASEWVELLFSGRCLNLP
jgi:hypothetical protein